MGNTTESSFKFNGFRILRSLIDRKEGELSKQFKINFKPAGKYFVSKNRFRLQLGLHVLNDSGLLTIELDAIADYEIKGSDDGQKLSNFFYINAPAILFPYIRAYISTLTTLSGIPTVTLPTLNLTNLAEELERNTERVE
jgi:preprotein translocase subunit SecB